MTLDIRDTDLARRDSAMQSIERASQVFQQPPGLNSVGVGQRGCAGALCSRGARSARRFLPPARISVLEMVSRATTTPFSFRGSHRRDALHSLPQCYSHRPDEYAAPEDIARARWS